MKFEFTELPNEEGYSCEVTMPKRVGLFRSKTKTTTRRYTTTYGAGAGIIWRDRNGYRPEVMFECDLGHEFDAWIHRRVKYGDSLA